MKHYLLLIVALLCCNANAAIKPFYQDIKLPSQQIVEKQSIANPAAAGTADVLSAHAGNTSAAAASATVFVAQPDVPRSLVVTPGTSTLDVNSCIVTVSGTNFLNAAMSEGFAFGNDASVGVSGALAFKTVTSVSFPAGCEDGSFAATWSIGYGEKLGVKRCMDSAGHVLFSTVAGAYESTRPTVAVGSSVQGNTADYNGTMDGSSDFELFFFQNFKCGS